jgi:NAD(P)-dependent dehydrogenase (short-subunit alcohol dehydrogenase family)
VLVTGGTGCIGSALIKQLAARGAGRIVSVSRGATSNWPRCAVAEYRYGDVRDRAAMDRLIGAVRPDLIFHLAAQRDPGWAEVAVRPSVSTNVLGTRTVLAAAPDAGVPQVVYASTGKAMRPFSPDIYAASKRAAEWIASDVAGGDDMVGADRHHIAHPALADTPAQLALAIHFIARHGGGADPGIVGVIQQGAGQLRLGGEEYLLRGRRAARGAPHRRRSLRAGTAPGRSASMLQDDLPAARSYDLNHAYGRQALLNSQ